MPRNKCAFHCGCGSHFLSLHAFDCHRRTGVCWDGSEAGLEPVAGGICDLGFVDQIGCVLWQTAVEAKAA